MNFLRINWKKMSQMYTKINTELYVHNFFLKLGKTNLWF